MLSRKDNRLNSWYIQLTSLLCILPVELEKYTGRISLSPGGRWDCWLIFLTTAIIHTIYSFIRVALKFYKRGVSQIQLISFDYPFTVANLLGWCVAIKAFWISPKVTATLFNDCMTTKDCDSKLYRVKKYMWVELLTISFPVLVLAGFFTLFPACTFAITWPLIRSWNALFIGSVTMVEAVVFICWSTWLYFGILLQLLYLGKVNFTLKNQILALRKPISTEAGMGAFRELRKLQLGMALFNEGNAAVVYAFKIAAIGAITTTSFAVIRFFHENPFLGLVNSSVSLETAFLFTAMYDKGFTIPKCAIELKRKFPAGLRSLHVSEKKDKIKLLERNLNL